MGRIRMFFSRSATLRSPSAPRALITDSRMRGALPLLPMARSMAPERAFTSAALPRGQSAGGGALRAAPGGSHIASTARADSSAMPSDSALPVVNCSAEMYAGIARGSREPARIGMASRRVASSSGCSV